MTVKIFIEGMSCAACSAAVERAVSKIEGVENINVNLMSKFMTCDISAPSKRGEIIEAINAIGFKATSEKPNAEEKIGGISEKRRLLISLPLLILLMYVAMGPMIGLPHFPFIAGAENSALRCALQIIFTLPIIIVNRKFYISGFSSLFRGNPNMDSLVAVSSTAALLYSGVQSVLIFLSAYHGDISAAAGYSMNLYYDGAAMILTLVTLGKMLEERSKKRTGDAISKLMDLSPKTAICIKDGREVTVNTEDIFPNDIILIRPGERIPVDGEVIEGTSAVDESMVTGESIPSEKNVGSAVIAGTLNGSGVIKIVARKVGSDTVLAQIIEMVENASAQKAPIARLADKVAGKFVPVVIGISVVTVAVWLIFGYEFFFALTKGISVLVISCPCALGLATPVAVTVSAGKCAQKGILIRSVAVLEALHKIDTVLVDKTGTLTEGKPKITAVYPNSISENELIRIAASLEKNSEHPLAVAVLQKAEGAELYNVDDFEAVPGYGLKGRINGELIYGGNALYMERIGIDISCSAADNGTVMYFADSRGLLGTIYANDTVKASSVEAIESLHNMGKSIIMLTGDSAKNADAVGKELGIDRSIGGILPKDKADWVTKLQREGRCVAMVGDGINDSPALAAADIGIAIGNGTDIAIDSADIVLTNSDLRDVPEAIRIGRRTMRIIKQNLFWAFIYNIIGIPIAAGVLYPAFGIALSPMLSAACMSLSSIFVNLNALRIKKL